VIINKIGEVRSEELTIAQSIRLQGTQRKRLRMNHYDMMFIGHMSLGIIVPFEGPPIVEKGSPLLYASIAASRFREKIAGVTRIPEGEDYLLEPMRAAGIDLFVQPGEIIRFRMVYPNASMDERDAIVEKDAGPIVTTDCISACDPCLVHFCWIGARRSQLNLMRTLKERGFRLSVDMQNFMFRTYAETGIVYLTDFPEKNEILGMTDFVKLDAHEAELLTGSNVLQDQADILEGWGSSETLITCSKGALVQKNGKSAFEKFTNRSIRGRMGRGDTCMATYLARRLDHSIEDSLRFAVTATSMKLESSGPFSGSMEDVVERMNNSNNH
jgi:sugar/nucleoside kinase (ribokinase family)